MSGHWLRRRVALDACLFKCIITEKSSMVGVNVGSRARRTHTRRTHTRRTHIELCAGGIGHNTHDSLRRQFSGGNTDLTLASFTKMLIDNKKPVTAHKLRKSAVGTVLNCFYLGTVV